MRKILLLGCLLVPWAAARLGAEPLRLPAEMPVAATEITLDLTRTAVEITVDPAAVPALAAGFYEPQASPVTLELLEDGPSLTIRRTQTSGPSDLPLWLTLVVGPSQRLRVRGSALGFTLDASGLAPETATPELTLDLAGSEVQLTGTRGPVALTLEGGRATVTDHRGDLRLKGGKGAIQVLRHQGRLSLDLSDGTLELLESEGELKGRAAGGSVWVDRWRGHGTLSAAQTGIEMTDSGDKSSHFRLDGELLAVSVHRFEGDWTAALEGGRLDGSGLAGQIRITGRGQAAIVLQQIGKSLNLDLAEGSSAQVLGMDGRLSAMVKGSSLEAEDVRLLGIQAVASEVSAQRVGRLQTVSAQDSRLTLDLAAVENDPALLLHGNTLARVRLPLPCEVRLAAMVDAPAERIRPAGCELVIPGSGIRQMREEGTVILKVTLDPESHLEVESVTRPKAP